MITLSGSLLLTFRELWAMRLTQAMFAVATLAWLLLSFALNMDVVEGSLAAIRIFGFDTSPTEAVRDAATGEWVQQAVSLDNFMIGINTFVVGAAYFLGTMLGLFATMPLVGGFLEQGRIDLVLSKPLSRPRLLLGHLIGVWITVLVLAAYLIGGVWLSMALKTGMWIPRVLWAIPIITVMFAVMYSVILFFGVSTRSSGLGLVIAYGLVFISVILASHQAMLPVLSPAAAFVFQGFYHALPNFAEVVQILAQLVAEEPVTSWYPLTSSLLFGGVLHALAFLWFVKRDF
ncbi:MAG: ABC transporter permease subunit [Bacteroidetes bacterium]|nr:ABC transporter permease subunit [Bacteroidota bacterium]MDA0874322.1 ABC transporter permease subunit [Bacteroidota bacterium]